MNNDTSYQLIWIEVGKSFDGKEGRIDQRQ